MVILVDTNVILDFLISRKPFSDTSENVLRLIIEGKCKGFIAAHRVTNIFYILRKSFSAAERKKMLIKLCEFVEIAGVQKKQIINALLNEEFADLEDRLQVECALSVNADYIVTRNIIDFQSSPIMAIQPEDFLVMINKEQGKENRKK